MPFETLRKTHIPWSKGKIMLQSSNQPSLLYPICKFSLGKLEQGSTALPACHCNCWYFNLIKESEFFFLLFWLCCLLALSHSLVLNKCRTCIYRICNLRDCLSDLSNTLIEHLLLLQFWISFTLTGLDRSLWREHRSESRLWQVQHEGKTVPAPAPALLELHPDKISALYSLLSILCLRNPQSDGLYLIGDAAQLLWKLVQKAQSIPQGSKAKNLGFPSDEGPRPLAGSAQPQPYHLNPS